MANHAVQNGVNTAAVNETASAIRQNPQLAKCNFHVTNRWINGGHNRCSIREFYGAKHEISHHHPFVLEEDEPELLAGHDNGPNPSEYLLTALAGCMTSSMVYHAALRGIHIEQLECTVDGDLDLQGFLGLDSKVRNGFEKIRVRFKIMTDEQNLERLKQFSEFSSVLDTLRSGTHIDIEIEPK